MSPKKSIPVPAIIAVAFCLLVILAAIVARPLFLLLCVFAFFFLFYKYAWNNSGKVPGESMALRDIRQSIKDCDQHLEKLQLEILDIQDDIEEMSLQVMLNDDNLRPEVIADSKELIQRFEEQLALRRTKINFYNTCKQKLSSLEANHLLAIKLEKKQQKLQQLRENQYEELANMESLKDSLEREVTYLKTIDQLRLRMLNSQSLQEAEALKLELVTVTEELKNL